MVVTFLGHRNSPPDLQPQLESLLIHLIEHQGASHFYIGNHGHFDFLVRRTLEKLSSRYTHIHFEVVLAYLPTKNKTDCSFSIFPFVHQKSFVFPLTGRSYKHPLLYIPSYEKTKKSFTM